MESKTKALKSVSETLRNLANECEKEVEPEKRQLKDAVQKGNTRQIEKHTKNLVQIRHEAVNYRRMVIVLIPWLITLTTNRNKVPSTGNPKKMVKAMNKIEKHYFDKEVVAKFKSSSATESTPTFMSEDEKPHNWFDIFKVQNLIYLG
ncbi:hypothetical protein MKW94_028269 [Papaver nudicaule]|uniref:Uncharacterized protein n=1 Tax=Papaver nudicaule TaxID=74823 RepID=A0AA41VDT1_PAPNU|nr:hypothetical protein [Papaver nudicaule]